MSIGLSIVAARVPIGPTLGKLSTAAIGNEMRRRLQYRAVIAKRRNRPLSLGDKRLEPLPRPIDP
jgi:hypothetical protein